MINFPNRVCKVSLREFIDSSQFSIFAYWYTSKLTIIWEKSKWSLIMSNQNSQSHKRQEKNTEWLDELINQIESNIRRTGGKNE